MTARAPSRPHAAALALALLCAAPPARAVDDDVIGWWIYVGAVRSALAERYLGPEPLTPEKVAIEAAGRGCRLRVRIDRLDRFRETPLGADPVVFGPFLDLERVAAALACVRRSVPGARVTQALPPS